MAKYNLKKKTSTGLEEIDLTANVDLSEYKKIKTGTIFFRQNSNYSLDTSEARNFLIKIIYVPDTGATYNLDVTITIGSQSASFSLTEDLLDGVYIEKIGNSVYAFDKYGNSLLFKSSYTVNSVQLKWTSDDGISSSKNVVAVYKLEV